jgi:cell shape-determining protein MreD
MVFFLLLEVLTELNAIYTSSFSLIVSTIFFILFRRDLLFPSLMCGLISMAISMVVYWILLLLYPSFFDMFWIEDTITGLRFLFIPLEEYLFHFALGSCVGVMYEIGYAEVDKGIKK